MSNFPDYVGLISVYLDVAVLLCHKGSFSEAVPYLQLLLKPNRLLFSLSDVQFLLAWVLRCARKDSLAQDYFRQALKDPTKWKTWAALASTYADTVSLCFCTFDFAQNCWLLDKQLPHEFILHSIFAALDAVVCTCWQRNCCRRLCMWTRRRYVLIPFCMFVHIHTASSPLTGACMAGVGCLPCLLH